MQDNDNPFSQSPLSAPQFEDSSEDDLDKMGDSPDMRSSMPKLDASQSLDEGRSSARKSNESPRKVIRPSLMLVAKESLNSSPVQNEQRTPRHPPIRSDSFH